MAPEALTDDQAAVYDRQLRLWGHEVQQRLTMARVLIIGGDGLAAEIAKNLVLAGVGHVALSDDTPVSQAPFGNFLVTADATDPTTVAEASAQTLSAMNPLITCTAVSLSGAACTSNQPLQLQPEQVADFDLVISTCGLSCASSDQLEQICAAAGKQLYVGEVVGPLAYAFLYLGPTHAYSDKPADKQEADQATPAPAEADAPPASVAHTQSYARLEASLSRPVKQCMGRRPPHALYQVLRAARKFESVHGRPPAGEGDVAGLQAVAAELEASEGAPPGTISAPLLQAWAMDRGAPPGSCDPAAAPACAVAGGVLANSAVRAISRVGAPLKNWFFFSLHDGSGMVEDIGGPLP